MGRYITIDPEGTVTLRLPPDLASRRAELLSEIEERFGFEGLTADSEDEIDRFVAGRLESEPT